MSHSIIIIIAACLIGIVLAWGVGANALANIMSTTMGSKAITLKQALVIAIVFEFAGAMIGGIHVTHTISNGIINITSFVHHAKILIEGMLATSIAGVIWMLFSSYVGIPVSITDTIVGALVGFGAIVLGVHAIHWKTVELIGIAWVLSPIVAGWLSYWLFTIIKRTILASEDPCQSANRYLPIFFLCVGIMLTSMIVLKNLSEYGYSLNLEWRFLLTLIMSVLITLLGVWLCNKIYLKKNANRHESFEYVEKLFGILMIFTACAMVFAHGSNDVAIAIGPIVAIFNVVKHHGNLTGALDGSPTWALFMGYIGVILGLFMYGHKVIATVGRNITALTPSRAFAATIVAAGIVILSTSIGIPVPATQTLVGGVLGVGLARGISAINMNIVRNIILSWIVTLPAAALLTIVCFKMLQWLF